MKEISPSSRNFIDLIFAEFGYHKVILGDAGDRKIKNSRVGYSLNLYPIMEKEKVETLADESLPAYFYLVSFSEQCGKDFSVFSKDYLEWMLPLLPGFRFVIIVLFLAATGTEDLTSVLRVEEITADVVLALAHSLKIIQAVGSSWIVKKSGKKCGRTRKNAEVGMVGGEEEWGRMEQAGKGVLPIMGQSVIPENQSNCLYTNYIGVNGNRSSV